jgi:Flp pilus assembly protein TadD
MDTTSDKWRRFLIRLLLAVATVIVYAPVGSSEFVSVDDPGYVTRNPNVWHGLTWDGARWAFAKGHMGHWHPVTWLSHMLDCQLFGLNAGAHHLMNLALHVANTLLLFSVLRRLTGALWRSALVAALFALHPLHVESVAWVAERKDVLSTFFWLTTIWAYTRYAEKPRWPWYLLAIALFGVGLMAKSMLVTLPFVLLLLDYWPLKRMQLGAARCLDTEKSDDRGSRMVPKTVAFLLAEKVPFLALAVVSSVMALWVSHLENAIVSLVNAPVSERIGRALVSYVGYIIETFWPVGLAFAFNPEPMPLSAWQIVGAGLVLLGVSVLIVRAARRQPGFLVGWSWYLGTLVPVIGIVAVGDQNMNDRYTYIPLIGLFIMFAWGAAALVARWPRSKNIVVAAVALALVTSMIFTRRQVGFWKNSVTLFERTVAVSPNNYLAHNHLATNLDERGRTDDAIAHYREALRLKPDFVWARNNLGIVLARMGKTDEAIIEYLTALQFDPDYEVVHFNLANALVALGKLDQAASHYTTALQTKPTFTEAHISLGNILRVQGKSDDAVGHYRSALRLTPDEPSTLNHLAWILATDNDAQRRNGAEAVQLAERACALTDEKQLLPLRTLAAAYAEAGRFEDAQRIAQKVIALAESLGQTELRRAVEEQLAFYATGRPYRAVPAQHSTRAPE